MKIGLYFGSFNPIHIGHMAIANYMLEYTSMDEVWFVISPQNPFKNKKSLLQEYHRLELVNLAIEGFSCFRASSVEFSMLKPSYTVDTLALLGEKYPSKEFTLILGSDNLEYIHKWKNSEVILKNHELFVYPRPGFDEDTIKDLSAKINIVPAPLMEISSSFIRKAVGEGKEIPFFMPEKSYRYMKDMFFYKK